MYRVEWIQSALDALTEIWLQSDTPRRDSIRDAVDRLEQSLKFDPRHVGESRGGDNRICFVDPLAVKFRIEPRLSLVTVLYVGRIRRKEE